MDALLTESFDQFLSGHCTAHQVRAIEAGASADRLWQEMLASGFVDALVMLEQDGAGLCMTDVAPLILCCGRHAMPLPLAQTMVVRAALCAAGIMPPTGSISIASQVSWTDTDGARMITASNVPYGAVADWVLLNIAGDDCLLPLAAAERIPAGGHGSLMASALWHSLPEQAIELSRHGQLMACDWQAVGGALMAAQIAGAMEKLTNMTIAYANERAQFGKPISKLQIIQQQISVMAEQTFAARSAALLGLASADTRLDPLRAAVAKARTSEAAVIVAALSHSVHGAIGVTEEYDLQLYTRRLHEWRMQYGSESFWHAKLGQCLLEAQDTALQFIHKNLAHRHAATPI